MASAESIDRLFAAVAGLHPKLDAALVGLARMDARLDAHDREIAQLVAADHAQDEQITGLRETRAAAQGGLRASGMLLAGLASAAGLVGGALGWLLARGGP